MNTRIPKNEYNNKFHKNIHIPKHIGTFKILILYKHLHESFISNILKSNDITSLKITSHKQRSSTKP